jgi:hypothetical protein
LTTYFDDERASDCEHITGRYVLIPSNSLLNCSFAALRATQIDETPPCAATQRFPTSSRYSQYCGRRRDPNGPTSSVDGTFVAAEIANVQASERARVARMRAGERARTSRQVRLL